MTVEFPKTLYATILDAGTEEEFLVTGSTPEILEDTAEMAGGNRSVKVARYVLAGTGVIQQDSPYYTEDAHS